MLGHLAFQGHSIESMYLEGAGFEVDLGFPGLGGGLAQLSPLWRFLIGHWSLSERALHTLLVYLCCVCMALVGRLHCLLCYSSSSSLALSFPQTRIACFCPTIGSPGQSVDGSRVFCGMCPNQACCVWLNHRWYGSWVCEEGFQSNHLMRVSALVHGLLSGIVQD